ncbi:MAG: hypothetical protein IH993_07875 [Proteobacteria bacterium]|nr:hypothetical protein [Pseudomonadota bacterium]
MLRPSPALRAVTPAGRRRDSGALLYSPGPALASADATGTLGYCRASSSNAADTPLDDHIDGEAGTSGADWNFNTLSIVAGATVSATAWTVTLPES